MNRNAYILLLLLSSLLGLSAYAQAPVIDKKESLWLFDHLDVGIDLGTTGVGVSAAMPVTKWLDARAGVSYFPRFNIPMTFGLSTFDTGGVTTDKFDKMAELLYDFMGVEIDDEIHMNAKSTMWDFKFLLDFKPLPSNDHWHLTVGFHFGTSRIGHIENTIYEMQTLVGVTMYNSLYDYFVNEEYMEKPLYGTTYIDPEVGAEMAQRFYEYGRVGVHLGTFTNTTECWNKGENYIMEPNKDSMVLANMRVSHFKPYIGAGYATHLSQDKRWKLTVDAGCLFWGGTPSVITHNNTNYAIEVDGETVVPTVNMSKDLEGVHGKVGNYLDFAKSLKVYPVLNVRFSYTIF